MSGPDASVLSTISPGDSLNLLLYGGDGPPLSVLAVYPSTGNLLVLADAAQGGEPEFIAPIYEYGGDNTAKLTLRWSDEDYWLVSDGGQPVPDALITGPGDPAQFLLTDTGAGITMQVIYPQELGYVSTVEAGSVGVLTSGHPVWAAVPLVIGVEP